MEEWLQFVSYYFTAQCGGHQLDRFFMPKHIRIGTQSSFLILYLGSPIPFFSLLKLPLGKALNPLWPLCSISPVNSVLLTRCLQTNNDWKN